MSNIRKSDFYYGSLLSVFINNGIAPAIIEAGDERRIYSVTTDRGEYEIYTKYVSKPAEGKNKHKRRWAFSFSQDELQAIEQYQNNGKNYVFALICGVHEEMQNSEIAVLSLEEVKDCLGLGFKRPSYCITVKTVKNQKGLRVYGTGQSDQLHGRDNPLHVKRGTLPIIGDELAVS